MGLLLGKNINNQCPRAVSGVRSLKRGVGSNEGGLRAAFFCHEKGAIGSMAVTPLGAISGHTSELEFIKGQFMNRLSMDPL